MSDLLKFIIRLDDACPNMDEIKWKRVCELLDKYEVKPLIGIIPDSKDKTFNKFPVIENFWQKYAQNWQQKGYIIAQHGLHHNLNKLIRTEYRGVDYESQVNNLKKGYQILKENKITPICFFAPNHSFDKNTIKACKKSKLFKFISDGYAFYPYKYCGFLHMPSVFDTPRKIFKKGIFTFVYHPNKMIETDFEYLEKFLIENKKNFDINLDEIMIKYENRRRNILDLFLMISIKVYRKFRNIIFGNKELKEIE